MGDDRFLRGPDLDLFLLTTKVALWPVAAF
jgi:hypothetical protein